MFKICESCHHLYVVEIKANGNVVVYKQGIPVHSNERNCVWCGAEEKISASMLPLEAST